jgi:integrase
MQERLGHSTVAFTLDIYSHAVPTMQEEAAASVARLFDA